MTDPTFVVVGAGMAGGAAVHTLRAEGFGGRIALIGREPHPPYERPPLSKEYLRGEVESGSFQLHPEDWYAQNDVELMAATGVARVDVADRAVVLDGDLRIPYDRVLIATGAQTRPLLVPGHEWEGILDLRTVEGADRIRAAASAGGRAAVVGAGFIGCETAASLRALGMEVDVVEIFDVPLQRAVGPVVGGVFAGIHRDRGVRFHFNQVVTRIEGSGRVEAVVTNRGTRIECDLVVVGIGVLPSLEAVEGSGLALDDGLVVDEFCRAGSDDVYAAGDVTNHFHPVFGRRMRVEHFDNALKQGAAAATNMLGRREPFADPHWFWSDQYEHNLQYVGHAVRWDQFVVRGSLEERRFLGFYLRDGLVDAVVGLDRGRDVRRATALITARSPVDPADVRDEDVDLRRLAAELASRARSPRGGGR